MYNVIQVLKSSGLAFVERQIDTLLWHCSGRLHVMKCTRTLVADGQRHGFV